MGREGAWRVPVPADGGGEREQRLVVLPDWPMPERDLPDQQAWDQRQRRILEQRYLWRRRDGTQETPSEMLWRVARAIAWSEVEPGPYGSADEDRGESGGSPRRFAAALFSAMWQGDFLPNTPTLANAGRRGAVLSACTAFKVPDAISGPARYGGILGLVRLAGILQQAGAGVGYNLSDIREEGAPVRATGGRASGPCSFAAIYDQMVETIKQGGIRRGAQMATLAADHPDIEAFIALQDMTERDLRLELGLPGGGAASVTVRVPSGQRIRNMNTSVLVSDTFLRAAEQDLDWPLLSRFDGRVVAVVRARGLLRAMAEHAWAQGNPGWQNLTAIEAGNATPHVGPEDCVNPCGEQMLHDGEACNLGSVNLVNYLTADGRRLDLPRLQADVPVYLRALDDVIDMADWPSEMRAVVLGNRKVGLGVMGLASALALMGLDYGSPAGRAAAAGMAAAVQDAADAASRALAGTRGVFPNWEGSRLQQRGVPRRNSTVTTIAPTGSISLLARCRRRPASGGVSSGIEPFYALAWVRPDTEGHEMLYTVPELEEEMRRRGLWSEDMARRVAERGSCQGIDGVPDEVRSAFRTAFDLSWREHVDMQAAVQAHVENGIAKTVNLPRDATVEDVYQAFLYGWRQGLKGMTVYRDGSRNQVFAVGRRGLPPDAHVQLSDSDIAGLRPGPRPVPDRDDHVKKRVVETPVGRVRLFLVEDGAGHPLEVYVQTGKAGSDLLADAEAICRLISVMLRTGIGPEVVTDQLDGIGGSGAAGFGPQRVRSLADGIARVLREEYLEGGPEGGGSRPAGGPAEAPSGVPGGPVPAGRSVGSPLDLCPECGTYAVARSQGCATCLNCGWQAC
jgi:ribonucleoside-diphosphate reductase alpha chain